MLRFHIDVGPGLGLELGLGLGLGLGLELGIWLEHCAVYRFIECAAQFTNIAIHLQWYFPLRAWQCSCSFEELLLTRAFKRRLLPWRCPGRTRRAMRL